MEEKNLKKEVSKMKEKIKDVIDYDRIEEILKSNKIEFEYKDVKYKVTKPNFEQKQIANQKRIEKYTELLQAKDEKGNFLYKSEDELKKIYKERNIDIDALDMQYNSLEMRRNDYLFKLGEAIKKQRPENELEIFKKEIQNIFTEQQNLTMQKAVLLDSSLESQTNVFIYTYLAFLITEKLVKEKKSDKWVRAFNTYKEFIKQEENLVNTVVWHTSLMSRNEMQPL